MDVAQLRYLYNKANSSFKTSFVYHIGGEAGFFSEYNNMILGMLYCLDKQINFFIYSKDANFKCDKGWTDYFFPFCEEKGNIFHSFFNIRHIPKFKHSLYNIIYSYGLYCFRHVHPSLLTTYDLRKYIHYQDINKLYDIPELEMKGNLRSICQQLVLMTWVYNDMTKLEILNLKNKLSLPSQYVGLHIRRGDKCVEIGESSIDLYIKKAEQLSDLRIAFVSTDDYAVYGGLVKRFPNWTFITLCDENAHGYYQNEFVKNDITIRRRSFIELFASIEILCASEVFIGTFSSNVGMYIDLRRMSVNSYSVDIPAWKIW